MNKLNSVFVVEYEVTNSDNFFELPVGTIVYGAGFRSIEFTRDAGNCNIYNSLDDIKTDIEYIKEPHYYGGVGKYTHYVGKYTHYGLKIKIREIYRYIGKEIAY